MKNNFDECTVIGGPAVKPLIHLLKDNKKSTHKSAATSLIKINQSGKLNKELRELILINRYTIQAPHTNESKSSDCSYHHDSGIGLSFPV